jgi:hypothetical protein
MHTTDDTANRSTRRARRPLALVAAGALSLASITGLAACGDDDEGNVDDGVEGEVEDMGEEGEDLMEDTGDAIEENTDDMTDEEDDGATE